MKETMALRTYGFTTRALTVERHDEFSATTGAVRTCCVVLTIMQYSEQCLQPHDYLHQFESCSPLWASLYVMLHIALTPSCSASVEFSLNSCLLDRKSLVWRVSCLEDCWAGRSRSDDYRLRCVGKIDGHLQRIALGGGSRPKMLGNTSDGPWVQCNNEGNIAEIFGEVCRTKRFTILGFCKACAKCRGNGEWN